MSSVRRALTTVAALLLAANAWAQDAGRLKVSIVLYDPEARIGATIINHTMMIAKAGEPANGTPLPFRSDGTLDIALEPGMYVIHSRVPLPFQGNYHRWTRTFSVTPGETTVIELTVDNAARVPIPPPAASSPPAEPERIGPLTAFHVKYGAPQRLAAGVSVLVPIGELKSEDGFTGGRGVEIGASAGAGGWRVAGGPIMAAFPFWANLLGTVTRTSASPRGATPRATYLGVEAGVASIPIGGDDNRIVLLRPSVGVMHRVSGPAGPKRTTFTWSVDLQVVGGW